jgi:chemotaxis protein MotA
MGGHLAVTFQPWEFVIIVGVALGTFIIANSLATIKDTGAAIIEAILDKGTTQRDYLDVLGVL